MSNPAIDPAVKNWLNALVQEAKTICPDSNVGADYMPKPGTNASKATANMDWLEKLTTEQKMNAAVSLIAACIGAYGTYHTLQNVRTTDKNGQTKIDYSQVFVGFLQAGLTAGCAGLGIMALRGR